jgi:hypothetical protein
MTATWKRWLNRAALAAIAAAALAHAGCLAAAVGAAAGGAGALTYFYCTAPVERDYPVAYGDALTDVKAALADLQFPLVDEKTQGGGTVIETRTGDGVRVQIALDLVTSPVPADGSVTRVSVRVGHFGDEAISARIHDQIAKHVPPPVPPLARPAPPPPVETAAPPLATPVAGKK